MKMKLDENGNVVVIDDKPVYIDDDGKDVNIDVTSLYKKIQTVNNESASRKRKIAEMESRYETLSDVENIVEYAAVALKDRETVQNLSDKKLVEADKVDELKKQIKEAYESKHSEFELAKNLSDNEFKEALLDKDNKIYKLLVSSNFTTSPFFSGKDPKTVLLPEIAESYFGKHFKVEEDDSGELCVAGYIGQDRIPSRNNPGENANFEEAIAEIIDQFPMKDRILRAGSSGSGSAGNQGSGDESDVATLKKRYKDAKTTGNMVLAISLKSQLHAKGISIF